MKSILPLIAALLLASHTALHAADARELGSSIELSDDLSPLFQPTTVAGRKVGNRLLIQPMEGCDGTPDGSPRRSPRGRRPAARSASEASGAPAVPRA